MIQRKHWNVFTTHFVPSLWHGTGSWSPFSCKTRTYLLYIINIISADVLVTQGTRASATIILTMLNRGNSLPAIIRCTLMVNIFADLISFRCILLQKLTISPCLKNISMNSLPLIKILVSVKMRTSWNTYQRTLNCQDGVALISSSGTNYVFNSLCLSHKIETKRLPFHSRIHILKCKLYDITLL